MLLVRVLWAGLVVVSRLVVRQADALGLVRAVLGQVARQVLPATQPVAKGLGFRVGLMVDPEFKLETPEGPLKNP